MDVCLHVCVFVYIVGACEREGPQERKGQSLIIRMYDKIIAE